MLFSALALEDGVYGNMWAFLGHSTVAEKSTPHEETELWIRKFPPRHTDYFHRLTNIRMKLIFRIKLFFRMRLILMIRN